MTQVDLSLSILYTHRASPVTRVLLDLPDLLVQEYVPEHLYRLTHHISNIDFCYDCLSLTLSRVPQVLLVHLEKREQMVCLDPSVPLDLVDVLARPGQP